MKNDPQKMEYDNFESALRQVLSAPKEVGKKKQVKPKTKKKAKKKKPH